MKVALAQMNPTVGEFDGNRRKVIDNLKRAEKAGADLVVFPELTLIGYPPRDLLLRGDFIEASLRALDETVREVGKSAAVIGFVARDESGAQELEKLDGPPACAPG